MRRRVQLVAVAAAMAVVAVAGVGPAARPAAAQGSGQGPPATTSVIVVLDRDVPVPETAARLAAEHRGAAPLIFEAVLGGFQFVGPAEAVAGLRRARGVDVVVPDDEFSLVDVAGYGFFRIDADQSVSDPDGPYRGAGTRVALIDSGVDTAHRDLAPNLDLVRGYNCVDPGSPPEDDNGHGTHTAGIAAAAFNPDGYGIVGVAPEADIVPLRAFDASGQGSLAWILCAFDRLAQVTAASPVPVAVNMSFADTGSDTQCDDGDASDAMHEALCDLVDVGTAHGVAVVPVAAAGNDAVDAAGTIPAAFHDVITVSGLTDHDGAAGGAAGCQYIQGLFNYECDDTQSSFSNFGASVDLAAPAVDIYSTVPGGHGYLSGTSMAAPHVAGVVALALGESAGLDTEGVRSLLLATGECPDGTEAGADASCTGQGQWQRTLNRSFFDPVETGPDPDGIPEPVVNAARAARAADAAGSPPSPPPTDELPTVDITAPSGGSSVAGTVPVSGTSGDDSGVASIEVFVDGASIGTTVPSGDGSWSLAWDTTTVTDGGHVLEAVATDDAGQTATSASVAVTVANSPPPPASTTMHVGGLTATASGPTKKWTATATVRVVDEAGNPVEGVTVHVSIQSPATASLSAKGGTPGGPGGGGGGGGDGGGSGALSCVTGTDGRCSVSTKPGGTSIRFTVTDLVKAGWTYDSTADVDGDTSTGETDVVVSAP